MTNSKNHKQNSVRKKAPLSGTQKTIIIVIILAILVTIVAVIISFFLKPESLTKARIEGLAADYYENYVYENLINSDQFSGDLNSTMNRYKETGFTPVTLRQLILHDQEKTSGISDSLREYCDIERTTIRFFPESPFSRKDYRIDYNYVCNF